MNLDWVSIIPVLAVAAAVIFLVRTVLEVHKEKKASEQTSLKMRQEMSDYDKVLQSTSGLEKAREKNTGKHFDDETIYLNRAQVIREDSPLFTWINNG